MNPARIDRAREALPEDYEVAAYTGPAAPIATWGFAGAVESRPPQCIELAAPPVDATTAHGWSASGPGGIIYAVVVASPDEGALPADCDEWTVAAGHTTGTVAALPAPAIAAADTIGMTTTAITVVEGGTQTRSRADTFVAHLDGYVCFVALVTDPGSPYPALGAGFAADLLVKTVSTLRG